MTQIVVKKAVLVNVIYLTLAFVIFIFFTTILIISFTMDNINVKDRLISIFFGALSTLIFTYNFRRTWTKLTSGNPEFVIDEDSFRLFDNPHYTEIPLELVKNVELFKTRKHEYLGFAMKDNSHLKSNQSKYIHRIPQLTENDNNWIIIDLDFAKIKSEKLLEYLRKSVTAANTRFV